MRRYGIKGICFDLDGVLVDAADWHKEALNKTLELRGYNSIGNEEHETIFNGLSTYRKFEMLSGLGRLPNDSAIHKQMYIEKQLYTVEIIKKRCKPIQRVIDTVKSANDWVSQNIAVVTNCSRATAELMLRQANLLHMFLFLVTNEDVGGKIKPHPWPYLKAKEKLALGSEFKNILAIDDTNKGIRSAVGARMRTWKLKNFEDLTPENLDKIIMSGKVRI